MISKIKNYLNWKLRGEIPTENLIQMGLKVGNNFSRQERCTIDHSHCWLISIGDNVTLAPRVTILAHDASTKMHLGYAKIGRVDIGDNVFIGAGSTILPNVSIGNNVIIGAGSVVSKSIPNGVVVCGNPARVIYTLDEYIEKNKNLMNIRPKYNNDWTVRANISSDKKEKMITDLQDGIGYVE